MAPHNVTVLFREALDVHFLATKMSTNLYKILSVLLSNIQENDFWPICCACACPDNAPRNIFQTLPNFSVRSLHDSAFLMIQKTSGIIMHKPSKPQKVTF